MTNAFYTATANPATLSRGRSATLRSEYALIQTGFDLVAAAINIGAATGSSTTSMSNSTGTKTFTMGLNLAFSPGQSVVIAYTTAPTTQMRGTITSYSATTGATVVEVTGADGTGTYAVWSIALNPSSNVTTGSNTFTGVQNWATGASIASASTINLDTATGNRVHVTGTTTITAVTLTRGPRTLIFDGALTLTHHATNNNLPGGANIVTAAGDRAIYESDGTTVYCIAYIYAGVDHCIEVNTGNGYGSTNDKIRRYTTTKTSTGSAITYADSAANGASFTIVRPGLFEIHMVDLRSGAIGAFGASLNSAQLTTIIASITSANRLAYGQSVVTGNTGNVTKTVRLVAGDVVRPHTDGLVDGSTVINSSFCIRWVGP